jgi:hypothetical protein
MILKAINTCLFGEQIESSPDLPRDSFKYSDINFVRKNTTDYVRHILDKVNVQGKHKNVLVDIKVHTLKQGQIPALPIWHLDNTNHPDNPAREEVNHLFLMGDFCLTEFLKTEIEVDGIDFDSKKRYNWDTMVPERGVAIPANTIVTYGRHLHRAVPSLSDGIRLLIRVTETDTVRPINKNFEVTYR